jgi:hypothetical protein
MNHPQKIKSSQDVMAEDCESSQYITTILRLKKINQRDPTAL